MRVEYIRDGLVEEYHDGYFLLNSNPKPDNNYPYYLRSCAKPLQASLLIDNDIDLSLEELAFCSGSHAGEACHIEVAKKILKKFDLKETDLKCGIHAPLSRSMQDKMLLRGEKPNAFHNNCSGKHLGFLAICKVRGWDIKTYDSPEHPLQVEIRKKINEMCEVKESYPVTTDGCGVPILSMSLKNMLIGYRTLVENYPQIVNAILKNPYIYGGEDRLDTEIIQKTDNVIAKVGAGGLCIVFDLKTKDSFVVKMYDGSMPARRIAVFEIINRLGFGKIEYDNTIKTIQGKIVGEVKVFL